MDALLESRSIVEEAKNGPTRGRMHCLTVALDARNAFNSLPWPVIMDALMARNIPGYLTMMVSSYLEERTLIYSDEEGKKVARLTGTYLKVQCSSSGTWFSTESSTFPFQRGFGSLGSPTTS